MAQLLPSLALLACPVGMGLMMWMMMKMGGNQQPSGSQQSPQAAITPAQQAELAQLRAEVAQLRVDGRRATAWREPR
ncbi:hypothetical protein SAMN05661080_04184 [Modestobacter sp. DSM 44400]|uniref:hypothetical protein n=1 Tax=Modestobacter sp. DSM 44400 TaxID=1550230 RepID=UPI000895FB16|nr:hypothetical protein [Modestobacter sp. DSM 44400]SDY65757.1 hypothetical protein SAMN05661080_04184 [Modestobacter sp. DSM 44400]